MLSPRFFSVLLVVLVTIGVVESFVGIATTNSLMFGHCYLPKDVFPTSTALSCQLLGMNCATPTDFTFSLRGFCKRGGETDVHADGWGMIFYEQSGIRHFQDTEPASTSILAEFLSSHPIRTRNMMGHIRYATVGGVDLANVHPFTREMWGIQWCFCHNGEVPLFHQQPNYKLTSLEDAPFPNSVQGKHIPFYTPVGTTDSEATFCAILNALRSKFRALPSLPVLNEALQQLTTEITQFDPDGTILNFLFTCGPHTQWVYSWPGSRPGSKVWNGLHYTVREYPFRTAHLCDVDYNIDFSTCTTKEDCVSVIATKPLTDDEEWNEIERDQLILFDQGKPQFSTFDMFKVELSGHGLNSTVMERPVLEQDMLHYNLDPMHFQGGFI